MRKPTRPLARRIDERQPAPYQQRSPEPVFCIENERCRGCPYPAHGIICWHRDGTCLRTDIELHVEGTILLGRSSSCDVRIDDEQISRRNTELICRNGRLFANNISQTNGTMLNGLMISGERELHSGDTIVLGDTRITITF